MREGPVVALFYALDTQWKSAGMTGIATGLDYGAARDVADILGTPLTPAMLLDLKVMEAAALGAWAEQRKN